MIISLMPQSYHKLIDINVSFRRLYGTTSPNLSTGGFGSDCKKNDTNPTLWVASLPQRWSGEIFFIRH